MRRFLIIGSRCARSSTQTETSGGSSETEVKEFAVMPWTRFGAHSTVTTVTPVANWLSARRKSRDVRGADDIDFLKIAHLKRLWRLPGQRPSREKKSGRCWPLFVLPTLKCLNYGLSAAGPCPASVAFPV